MHHFEFLVLLGLFIRAQALTLEDLLEALNTTEKSWLTKRTYNIEGHECVYTEKMELTKTSYTFQQGYKKGDEKVTHTLYSKLGYEESTGPWMLVSHQPEATTGLKYYLEFMSKEEKCGILKVHLSGQTQYEVHVWDSNVDERKPNCDAKYQELSEGRPSHEVYSPICKSATQEN